MTHNRRSYVRDTVHRWEDNPAITLEDIPFEANTVLTTFQWLPTGKFICF